MHSENIFYITSRVFVPAVKVSTICVYVLSQSLSRYDRSCQCSNVNLTFSRIFHIFHFPQRCFHFPCQYWWYFFGVCLYRYSLAAVIIILSRMLLFVIWYYTVLGSFSLLVLERYHPVFLKLCVLLTFFKLFVASSVYRISYKLY